jgi:hypothetical protein
MSNTLVIGCDHWTARCAISHMQTNMMQRTMFQWIFDLAKGYFEQSTMGRSVTRMLHKRSFWNAYVDRAMADKLLLFV